MCGVATGCGEQFYERSTYRAAPGQPTVSAGTLRPVLDAFMQSAVASVLASRYEAPAPSPHCFDLTIHFAGTSKSDSSTVAQDSPLADGAVRVGGKIQPPRKIYDVRPVYPPDAHEARVQGVVVAEVRIGADSRVSATRIPRSIPMLDQAALDAIHQWEFEPTLLNGVATPVVMVATVRFTLQ